MLSGNNGSKYKVLRSERNDAVSELDKYKLLVESIQDYAIFLMDSEGYIRTWNKGAEKNKGYTAEEIIGKHFSTFYMQEDKDARKPEKELEIAIQFGRAEDEDWRLRKDGSKFWASVVITALYDNHGGLVGFAKVTRDLTERKAQEDEMRRANTILKAQQLELQKLNQSKDEFISLASHQLRTPATAIKQILGLYVEGFLSDIPEQHLAIIKKAYESNERQIGIVNSLLKVAQVDSGKVILKYEPTDVLKLTKDVVEEFQDSFSSRNQKVSFNSDSSLPKISVDQEHLRMALENIISNASKYTQHDGMIDIKLDNNETEIKVAISDTGVGISEDDMGTLFEKFKRIPNILSEEVGGTGLGLYWAQKVINLHGGHIEVESELGEGTTFNIYIPVRRPNA